jgi:hypothetical protein
MTLSLGARMPKAHPSGATVARSPDLASGGGGVGMGGHPSGEPERAHRGTLTLRDRIGRLLDQRHVQMAAGRLF